MLNEMKSRFSSGKTKFFLTAAILLFASVLFAQNTKTYLITVSHTPEQCMSSMDELKAKGKDILSNTYWGCGTGNHTAYVIVQAENETAALNMLPSSVKDNAKIVQVEKYTVDQIEAMHKGDMK